MSELDAHEVDESEQQALWGPCQVEGCEEHFKPNTQSYGFCNCCENFSICDKQDEAHYKSLLYWEECREHNTGGYSICISCATEAYRTHMEDEGKEINEGTMRCICPKCDHDFGLLTDLQ